DFSFSDGATLDGTITGGGADNVLDYSLYKTSITVNLPAGTATGTAGATGISEVIGGDGSDTLVGPNLDALWSITGANKGTISVTTATSSEYSFEGVENLTGGSNRDTFVVEADGSISGTVNGGSGADSLIVEKGTDLDYAIVNVVNGNASSVTLFGKTVSYT